VFCEIVWLTDGSPRAYKEKVDAELESAKELCDNLKAKDTKYWTKEEKAGIKEQIKKADASLKELRKKWETIKYVWLVQVCIKYGYFYPDLEDAAKWRPRCPRVSPLTHEQSKAYSTPGRSRYRTIPGRTKGKAGCLDGGIPQG